MTDQEAIEAQLSFFSNAGSGCGFATLASRDASKYEWSHRVIQDQSAASLDAVLREAIADPGTSTLSIIIPATQTLSDLANLIDNMNGGLFLLNNIVDTQNNRCYRIRAQIGDEQSYISGFGPFEHMPKTRQSGVTSIVMRVKPRPKYEWHLKEPEEGIVHVADMDMKGMTGRRLRRMWNNTFLTVHGILGKKPDEESAAKTTFLMPLNLLSQS